MDSLNNKKSRFETFKRRRRAKKRSLNFNRRHHKVDAGWVPGTLLTIGEIVGVIFLAYSLVYFFGKSVEVIDDSMAPSIYEEEKVLLNRIDYVFRRPKKGDVVAFRNGGRKEASVSIKRIIAVPGDEVKIVSGKIYINDELFEEVADRPIITDPGIAEDGIKLSDGEYFVLGDNRNHSTDSRYASVGNVKKDYMLGRVWFDLGKEKFGLVE